MKKRENPISCKHLKSKKSQVTVFVIIAIIIAASIASYFVIKKVYSPTIPQAITPVNDYYLSCVKSVVLDGANIMASQGGYIELPDFEPGSEHAPFSNQLGFMGRAVPYWYYISGNGIAKEQAPTKSEMESQLADYLEQQIISQCDFGNFNEQGFEVYLDPVVSARTTINSGEISVSLNQEMIVSYGNDTYIIKAHAANVNSRLGRFYELAKEIYDYEQSEMFLENYSVDVLYTYAPVSGAELSCSPMIWNPNDVFSNLRTALEQNIQMLKIPGSYYTSSNEHTQYFIAGKGSDLKAESGEAVNFLYSPLWPSRLEVWPTENDIMLANPVGNQPGLSAMGFCYVPYKFVYDVYFPVLIQIYNPDNSEEVFQFPIAVVLNKNVPRESLDSAYIEPTFSVCENANTEISAYTYNLNLEPVEANLKFKCITDVCNLGTTKIYNETGYSSLEALVPQCVNGVLIASAPGYKDKKYFISTNQEIVADIILSKKYKIPLEVYVDGSLSNEFSVITLSEISDENTSEYVGAVSYPYSREIEVSDGYYAVDVKTYRTSAINIPATTQDYCAKVPRAGVLGVLGLEEEKCSQITIPGQTVSSSLGAGGKTNYYFTQNELESANVIKIYTTSIAQPSSIAQLSSTYDQIEKQNIEVVVA